MITRSVNSAMTPIRAGAPFLGDIPEGGGVGFEFSVFGADLRLFYPDVTNQEWQDVQHGDIYLGLLRFQDLAIIPWRIGDSLSGDAQFHICLYPPELRPAPPGEDDAPLKVEIILVDTIDRYTLVARSVTLSPRFTERMRQVVAEQSAQPITRKIYDAQVAAFQREFSHGTQQVMDAAEFFEKTTPILFS